jgi:hypothetical protein
MRCTSSPHSAIQNIGRLKMRPNPLFTPTLGSTVERPLSKASPTEVARYHSATQIWLTVRDAEVHQTVINDQISSFPKASPRYLYESA